MKKHTMSCNVGSRLFGSESGWEDTKITMPYEVGNWFESLEEAVEIFGDESTVLARFRMKEDAHGPKGDARRAYYAEIQKFESLAKAFRKGVSLEDQLAYLATEESARESEYPAVHEVSPVNLWTEVRNEEEGAEVLLKELSAACVEHLKSVFGETGPVCHFGVTVSINKDVYEYTDKYLETLAAHPSPAEVYEQVLAGAESRGYARLARIFPKIPKGFAKLPEFREEFARWKKFRDEYDAKNKSVTDLLADAS